MSEPTTYRTHDDDPLISGSLRDRFKMAASLLWARGLPPPTADEIADAMVKVLVPVVPCKHIEEGFPNGHIERHMVNLRMPDEGNQAVQDRSKWYDGWCPGAGNGDNDDE